MSKTEVPKISLGIKSGVNCIRLKSIAKDLANKRADMVFATPGTPSISAWPLAKIEAISISIIPFWPTITLLISDFICATPCCNSERSILLVKLTLSDCVSSDILSFVGAKFSVFSASDGMYFFASSLLNSSIIYAV